ncbi:MAG: hypothetical protein AVDCRST_MAG34-1334 [uncultured Nocardioidaceae bacterium]|uniref:Uncharacterized protein n=1 Tax=uncultured Nocardioidaceae bacterium TaxID=253824 RepID=A0A6J4M2V7_9ACTN|nr:MAG: hypothetical protein AVDCRST_MAG34-1334 [uncultured Nocardioidaceae bacterium]
MPEEPLPLTVPGVIAGANLIAMLVVAGMGDRKGRGSAVLLGALSLLWFLTNKPMEGSVLVSLSETHGVVMADLVGLTGLGLAAWRLLLWRRARPAGRGLRRSRT